MSTLGKMAALQRQAMRLAKEVGDLLAKVEALQAELRAAEGAVGPRVVLDMKQPPAAAQAAHYGLSRQQERSLEERNLALRAAMDAMPLAQPANAGPGPASAPAFDKDHQAQFDHPAVIVCNIKAAWNLDIFSAIESLQSAGIPAIIERSNMSRPPSIGVTRGTLEQSVQGPCGDTLVFTWSREPK